MGKLQRLAPLLLQSGACRRPWLLPSLSACRLHCCLYCGSKWPEHRTGAACCHLWCSRAQFRRACPGAICTKPILPMQASSRNKSDDISKRRSWRLPHSSWSLQQQRPSVTALLCSHQRRQASRRASSRCMPLLLCLPYELTLLHHGSAVCKQCTVVRSEACVPGCDRPSAGTGKPWRSWPGSTQAPTFWPWRQRH